MVRVLTMAAARSAAFRAEVIITPVWSRLAVVPGSTPIPGLWILPTPEPLPGTSVEARLVKPYYNRIWDGEYAFFYNPPDKVTDKPALTINVKVAHFSHRIFTGYYDQAPVELRTVFANVLDKFLPDPLIKYENLPSFCRVFVSEQPGRKMVHLLSYVPEMRGSKTQMIEEPIELHNVRIALRNDGKIPKKVYLAPEKKSLPFKVTDGYINVTLPVSKGYSLIVFEM